MYILYFLNFLDPFWKPYFIWKSYLNKDYHHSKQIFLSFHWGQPTTWPANNCPQIMVCSCAMPSNCVWLQLIFCTCVKETVLFSFLRLLLCENGRWLRFPRIFIKKQTRWSNDKTIIELGYCKISWFVSVSQINYLEKRPGDEVVCLSLWLRQIIDLLATDKTRYFARPRPIIVNYYYSV